MGEVRLFIPDKTHAEICDIKERTGQLQNDIIIDLIRDGLDKRHKARRAPITVVDLSEGESHAQP